MYPERKYLLSSPEISVGKHLHPLVGIELVRQTQLIMLNNTHIFYYYCLIIVFSFSMVTVAVFGLKVVVVVVVLYCVPLR